MEQLKDPVKALSIRVDKYLDSLRYKKIVSDRDAYNTIYRALSKMTLSRFEEVDPTRNIIIDIRHNLGAKEITLTGYIKVQKRFIQLERVYSPIGGNK